MSNLNMIKYQVGNIIKRDNFLVNDNFKLYLKVLEERGIDTSLSIKELFENHNEYDLPPVESVTRSRRYWVNELGLKSNTEFAEENYKNTFA